MQRLNTVSTLPYSSGCLLVRYCAKFLSKEGAAAKVIHTPTKINAENSIFLIVLFFMEIILDDKFTIVLLSKGGEPLVVEDFSNF
jgi:hypothetical protein